MNKRIPLTILWPLVTVLAVYMIHRFIPDAFTPNTATANNLEWLLLVLGVIGIANVVSVVVWKRRSEAFVERGVIILTMVLLVWEVVVSKLGLLTPPFFPAIEQVVGVYRQDIGLLASSTLHSLRILILGYLLGAMIGVSLGFLVGWYKRFRWWGVPLIKVIGPIPATALTALAIAVFPGLLGSVFLISFAVTFPVFMNTWSGVAGVPRSLLETAQNLGADNRFLIWRVVLPSALPSIFTGLYIGLLVSFLTLVVAEALGVNAGLGWYIWRAQGWAEYYRVYAAVVTMGLIFSLLLTGLFTLRDRILQWQKGMVRW